MGVKNFVIRGVQPQSLESRSTRAVRTGAKCAVNPEVEENRREVESEAAMGHGVREGEDGCQM